MKVISPESPLKQYWDAFSNIFFMIHIFFIPIRVSFSFNNLGEPPLSATFIMYFLPPILMIFEIVLNFNTAFYK